ncbi:MAG: transposase [Verrucomicrobia bacterium]|nr:transposase [Verrucomicrobiota bacterium]
MSTSGYSWLSSALAKGCNYTLTLWSRLTRFLNYSQLDLSNNLVENAIRRLALRPATFFAVVVAAPAIPVLVAASEKIRKELGWVPRFPHVRQIIESAW